MALIFIPLILFCFMIKYSTVTTETQKQYSIGVLVIAILGYLIYAYFTKGGG